MCLSYRSIADREVVVRKAHRCEWCAYTIPQGERARNRVYVFDGEFTAGWMHLECYAAMNASASEVICEGWMPGDFERGKISA